MSLIPFDLASVVSTEAVAASEIPPGVFHIHAPEIWTQGYQGAGVVIAVLDTGCDIAHPDLAGQVIAGWNYTLEGGPNDLTDLNGHGTHVCGTIAALLNGRGVAGAAPQAKLLVIKVLNGAGDGESAHLVNAINSAVGWRGPNGERVRVISMSLGGPYNDPALQAAIINAVNNCGVLVVCASGNDGDGNAATSEIAYPGAYPEVVEVGAYDMSAGAVAAFSNTNGQIDLIAPGVMILSAYPRAQYAYMSGTSMATPHVSAAAALLIQRHEAQSGAEIGEPALFELLIGHTVSIGAPPQAQGSGDLNLVAP
ncbi:S8 family peptidase [Paenibacillus xanthanilyticus]|uniref:S8 family peptidase n=1 Tax=Paenibacillus xanthanilyticus TaxID=1783531 RepID=A0ABV8JWB8_9BACL